MGVFSLVDTASLCVDSFLIKLALFFCVCCGAMSKHSPIAPANLKKQFHTFIGTTADSELMPVVLSEPDFLTQVPFKLTQNRIH